MPGARDRGLCAAVGIARKTYCESCGEGRYICSNAKDAPKPVLSLLEEYWKIWVSGVHPVLTITSFMTATLMALYS